jgi:hypothetical protein
LHTDHLQGDVAYFPAGVSQWLPNRTLPTYWPILARLISALPLHLSLMLYFNRLAQHPSKIVSNASQNLPVRAEAIKVGQPFQ